MQHFPTLRVLRLLVLALSVWTCGAWAQMSLVGGTPSARVITPRAQTELIAHAPQGVSPGQTVWLGWRVEHARNWHTYWRNPGESGLPPEFQWTLPPGIEAGAPQWPLPQKIPVGNLMNYGYEGTLLLPVPLTVTPAFKPAPGETNLTVQLQATWLICRTECVPEEGRYTLRIPLQGSTALHSAAFDSALRARPIPHTPQGATALQVQGNALHLTVAGLPAAWRARSLDALITQADIAHASAATTQRWEGAVWHATLPLSPMRNASPERLGVVVTNGRTGWEFDLPVQGQWPTAPAAAAVSPALQAALDENTARAAAQPATAATLRSDSAASALSLGAALLGAFLGGLLLNLMPCVFPVLTLKVLSFARHAEDPRSHRISGLAYTAGVLLSFVVLGLLLIGLRAAGQGLGWGFQLQDPLVVTGLALLFTLIALNLAGVFEFGQWLPSSLASLQARHPVIDAFLTGVLAVAVASPCTAPFMGASLGLTLMLPAWQALAVYLAVGLGLATPYLLASWIPAVARALPKPGAWMLTLRRLLAFPMWLTVVWLVWVLGQQVGTDGAAALLVLLVLFAGAVWAGTLAGRTRAVLMATFALLGGATLWLTPPLHAPDNTEIRQTSGNTANPSRWQDWSPERQAELLAQGRTVFVDYTAAWCVTCQVNERSTLRDAEVLADFDARQVVMLRADWTRRDPRIGRALAELGRNGVPVYVLLRPGQPPRVLPEMLSPATLRGALAEQ